MNLIISSQSFQVDQINFAKFLNAITHLQLNKKSVRGVGLIELDQVNHFHELNHLSLIEEVVCGDG